ncbi:hypothetical protein HDA32_003047 [Spinactinospora alkalitolerans]|uniref:DUF397 domain-containing protein n=1 Tax=Spinactinospora alkalitolerans TaxID=687207 RepID=A0A852TXA1_9ACTN|nr:DUF397 domain-containing protein [Spinactinospora alkalitolerans]NYE47927.1 hypothetical protein [Spinactinospora alkalitolerans]
MIGKTWEKSSYSKGGADNCVECRSLSPATVDVRDTQNRSLGHLGFSATEWASLLRDVKADRL